MEKLLVPVLYITVSKEIRTTGTRSGHVLQMTDGAQMAAMQNHMVLQHQTILQPKIFLINGMLLMVITFIRVVMKIMTI